ncbi:hypothetical protein F4677DRAFT_425291 [Hypoxylon crocopeplum]|nr:hypothetical protein F4677DRAFT_425291 [Hypoxylon crocopeplum]
MAVRSVLQTIAKPATWALGLDRLDSFATIFRQCRCILTVPREFLESSSAKLVNPRQNMINSDTVSLSFPASTFRGLSDEKLLALFTKGFFGGWVFYLQSLLLKAGAWKIIPVKFTGFRDNSQQRDIWSQSDIPETTLLPVGDTLYRCFKVIDVHLASASNPYPSYVDFGYGQDQSVFTGCHRFRIVRSGTANELGEENIEFNLEGFRCNPRENIPSAAEIFAWFHVLYAELLFARSVQACLQRRL